MRDADQIMRSDIYARFGFSGFDCDPDEITAFVGIIPSRVRRVGDPPPSRMIIPYRDPRDLDARRARVNLWSVHSDIDRSLELSEHIRALFERLDPGWQQLAELGKRYDAVLTCVIETYGGDRPEITFDKETLRRVVELNAELGVDLYNF